MSQYQGPLVLYHLVEAGFPERPEQLDLRTTVHDDFEAGRFRQPRRRVIAHADLHPDDFGADFNRSSVTLYAASDVRNTCTMSTGRPIEDSDSWHLRPRISAPASLGLTGIIS